MNKNRDSNKINDDIIYGIESLKTIEDGLNTLLKENTFAINPRDLRYKALIETFIPLIKDYQTSITDPNSGINDNNKRDASYVSMMYAIIELLVKYYEPNDQYKNLQIAFEERICDELMNNE